MKNKILPSLQAVIISRFLINLRSVDKENITASEGNFSRFSVPNFRVPTIASIVGDMGEQLVYDDSAEATTDRD